MEYIVISKVTESRYCLPENQKLFRLFLFFFFLFFFFFFPFYFLGSKFGGGGAVDTTGTASQMLKQIDTSGGRIM